MKLALDNFGAPWWISRALWQRMVGVLQWRIQVPLELDFRAHARQACRPQRSLGSVHLVASVVLGRSVSSSVLLIGFGTRTRRVMFGQARVENDVLPNRAYGTQGNARGVQNVLNIRGKAVKKGCIISLLSSRSDGHFIKSMGSTFDASQLIFVRHLRCLPPLGMWPSWTPSKLPSR